MEQAVKQQRNECLLIHPNIFFLHTRRKTDTFMPRQSSRLKEQLLTTPLIGVSTADLTPPPPALASFLISEALRRI